MKKILATSLLCLGSLSAQADIAGMKAGVEYWPTSDHKNSGSAYFQLEPPIPLLPNLSVRANRLETKDYSLTNYDISGYYEILDNDLVSIDLGAGLHYLSPGSNQRNLGNETLGMLTSDIELLPDNQLSFYGKMNLAKGSDATMTDINLGARLRLISGIYVQAGYKQYKLEQDSASADFSDTIEGPVLGLHLDI